MPKGRLRGFDALSKRHAQWIERVAVLLAEAQFPQDDVSLQECAATIVGMFDAGARDVEVVQFLESRQGAAGAPRNSHVELAALAVRLHRAAAEPGPPLAT